MIRHILFDMGGVLVRWDPAWFVSEVTEDPEDRALLLRVCFKGTEWVRCDRGTLSEREALELFRKRLPERLHAAAEELVLHWDRFRRPYPGMEELAEELRDRGYDLCLFSNAGLRHHEYWPTFSPARLFGERVIISADLKHLKPEREYYEEGLRRLGVRAEECFFIDDNAANVEAAALYGIDGAVFHGDALLLREELKEKGIL